MFTALESLSFARCFRTARHVWAQQPCHTLIDGMAWHVPFLRAGARSDNPRSGSHSVTCSERSCSESPAELTTYSKT